MPPTVRILPASDTASLVVFTGAEPLQDVHRFAAALRAAADACVRNVQPAAESVLVVFDPLLASHADLERLLVARLATAHTMTPPPPRTIEIPVVYGGEWGPDLADVAVRHGLVATDVVRLHTEPEYRVAFLGFVPGFAYLDGLSPQLVTPRHDSPRARVPAGSVAIGGARTGIYPLASPGGWRLIGRTPLRLFRPQRAAPAMLELGDRVRFRSIAPDEFEPLARQAGGAAAAPDDAVTAPPHIDRTQPAARAGGSIHVEKPGLLSTVQDLGRPGWAHLGVSAAGSADPLALRVCNRLVGNADGAAAIEMTLVGGTFVFERAAVVALGGALFDSRCDGAAVPWWRAWPVRAGARLEIGPARTGARCLLCVRGGIDVTPFLGSASTHVVTGVGGYDGRALVAGDRLALGASPEGGTSTRRHIEAGWIDSLYASAPIRVTTAPQTAEFPAAALEQLTSTTWQVREQSNRLGVRLAGASLPTAGDAGALRTEGVACGAIQVPPDGQPIVLFVEHQTTGGYDKIANVCRVDLHRIGQLRPRDAVRFQWVSFETARSLAHAREAEIDGSIPGAPR